MTRLAKLPPAYAAQIPARKPRRRKSSEADSDLERLFLNYWRLLAPVLPEPVTQYYPLDDREFRLDFCWPNLPVPLGIEVQGSGGGGYGRVIRCHACGATVRARLKNGQPGKVLYVPYPSHASGEKMQRDAVKHNLLVLAGWKLLYFTSAQIHDDPAGVIETVRKGIEG